MENSNSVSVRIYTSAIFPLCSNCTKQNNCSLFSVAGLETESLGPLTSGTGKVSEESGRIAGGKPSSVWLETN